MSGFYLTSTAVHTGITAAQESVSLFDGIFGSNESSRALCASFPWPPHPLSGSVRFG